MIELYVLFSGGKRGQRGGQTGAKKKQTEEHETARDTVSERDAAALTQQFEDMSTIDVGGRVFQFSSCMPVNICASLINFFAAKSDHQKRIRKYSLYLHSIHLLDIDNPKNGFHISPHWKINCIINYNKYHII